MQDDTATLIDTCEDCFWCSKLIQHHCRMKYFITVHLSRQKIDSDAQHTWYKVIERMYNQFSHCHKYMTHNVIPRYIRIKEEDTAVQLDFKTDYTEKERIKEYVQEAVFQVTLNTKIELPNGEIIEKQKSLKDRIIQITLGILDNKRQITEK